MIMEAHCKFLAGLHCSSPLISKHNTLFLGVPIIE